MVLKKLGAPIMTNLYYGTVKQLLDRSIGGEWFGLGTCLLPFGCNNQFVN